MVEQDMLDKTVQNVLYTVKDKPQRLFLSFFFKFSLIFPFFPSWDISVTNADNAQWLFATCAFKAVCHLIHCKQYNYMKD